ITLADIDSVTIDSASISISNNYASGEDSLSFSDHNGISGSWNASTGTMTLTGTATVAQYQEALRTVTYSNSSESPSTDNRTISFSVDDGYDSSNIATSTVTVTAVNDAPETEDSLVISDEDTPYIFTTSDFTFTDPDAGQTLQSITINQLPAAGQLLFNGSAVTVDQEITRTDLLAGRLRFEPEENENGNLYASFNFQVSDGELLSPQATFDFNITAVNDDPTVSSAITDTAVEDSVTFQLELLTHASDVDSGDTLSVDNLALSSGNDAGISINSDSLIIDPGAYDYLPEGQSETIVYSYDVVDGNGGSVSQTATLVITGTNDGAQITGVDTGSVTEDSHVDSLVATGSLTVTDADQGESVFQDQTLTGNYGDLTINADGDWTYTADNSLLAIQGLDDGETLSESFTVTTAGSDSHTINVTISGTNDAPVIDAGMSDQTATEEQAFNYQIPVDAFADIDGDSLTYSATLNDGSPLPSWVTFNPSNGTFSGTPDDPDLGQIVVKVTASDGDLSASGQFKINVTAVNDPPELQESPLVDGIVTALDFNTGAGLLANDLSSEGNDASFTGNVNWVSGHDNTGSAFNMDGTAGSAELQGLSTGGAMTISAWVQFDSFDEHWSRVLDFGNGQSDNNIVLGHTGDNNGIGFHIYSGGPDDPKGSLEINNFFTAGEWVHVTATVEADGTMSIYRNGELAGQADGVVPAEMVRTGNFLGKSHWSADGYLDGSIDELVITNGAVNADQAKAIYQADTVNNLLSDSFHVEEHSTSGTVVGSVNATDVDNPSLTYSLTNDAGGRFTIDSSTGEISVATSDSSLLDHETGGSHNITVQVSDGSLTDTRSYTIYLTDVNDAPDAQDETVSTLEDSIYTFTVSDFNFSDADEGDSLSQIRIDNLPEHGELLLNGVAVSESDTVSQQDITSGLLTFRPVLNANGDGYDSFSFSVADQQDVFSTTQNVMTVDVTAVNDAPVVSAGISHTVNEDHTITLTEAQLLVNASDIDGDNLTVSNVRVDNGSVGVTDNGNGTWTITPVVHWSGTSQLSFDISDGNASVTNTLSLAISPDADAPSLLFNNSAQNATVSVNEDTSIALNLAADLTDTDGSETLNVLIEDIPAGAEITDGSEIVTSTGGPINVSSWNLANLSVTPTEHHETDFSITVTATATEQSGGDTASTTREILIDIQPQNDSAIITGVNTGSVTEDDFSTYGPLGERELIATGDLDIQEHDAGEASFQAETVTGSYGELTINSSGQWEYIADSRQSEIQELGVTETLQDTLTVQSIDGTTHDITITIQGANDQGDGAPVFLGSLAEDNTLVINESSILNAVTDIDGDTLTVSAIQLPVGGHSIVNNNDGTWTLTPAQDFNGMLEMLYVFSDGTQGFEVNNLVRVNITSVADTAVISGDDTATLAEDSAATLTASGSLSVTDPDAGEAGFTAETINGSYGTLTIDDDGDWSYSANNTQTAIQSLSDNGSLQETLTVQSLDGTTHDITITFTGTNDGPVLDSAITNQSVAEDSVFSFQIPESTFSDEEGDALSYSATMADGSALPSWLGFNTSTRTFFGTPDNEDVGTLNLKVTATTPDGRSAESTFNLDITDTNDAPVQVFTESGGQLVFEAEHFHSSISRSGETWTTTSKSGASEGNVVTTEDGSGAYQGSTEGNSAELTYEVQVDTPGTYYVWVKGYAADGNADSVHLGLNGEYQNTSDAITGFGSGGNWSTGTMDSSTAYIEIIEAGRHQINLWLREDGFQADKVILTTDPDFVPSGNGPDESDYLNAPANQTATEDVAFSYTVSESAFTDMDAGDNLTWSATLSDDSPLPDWLSFNSSTRTFSGTPENSDVGSLDIKISVSDGDASTSTNISLSVTNVNDTAVISGVSTGTVTEDASSTLTTTGKLDINDIDVGESAFTAANFIGDYGTLSIDADGNWSYSADNNQSPIQQMGIGDDLTETFTVQSLDGTTQDITITLQGTNDAPTVSSSIDLGSIDEDNSVLITEAQLLANASDIDGDSLSISSLSLGNNSHGTITDNGNSTWTFTPAANFNGDDVAFNFVVSDGHSGGNTNSSAVIDVNAVADSPAISPDTSEEVVTSWGFEDTVIGSDWQDVNASPDGWSSAAGHFELQRNGADSNTAYEGNQWLELDTDQTLDVISYQADTSDGQPLIFEFATRERRADTTDDFEIYWNGEQIATVSPTDSWTVHRIELPPTGEDTTSLEIREPSGANDYEGSLIDDLKVLKVGISASDDPDYDFSITSLEDTSIPLNLGTVTSGGTESISTSLAGIPAGSVLTDGSNSINADGSNIDVSGWNLSALSLTPPAHSNSDFTITVASTATEGNGDLASNSISLRVELLTENDTPTAVNLDALSVSENSDGAIVGNLSSTDADTGDSHTYTVSDNRFEVVNGQLKLKDGISLDHETESSISLDVTTEDSEGASHTDNFTLSVTDINDAPVVTGPTSHSTSEDNSLTITKAELLANTTDADSDNLSISNVQVTSGQVSITDNGNDTWTVTPSADWSGSGELSFDISDGTVTVSGQADVTVSAVADTPDITVTGTTVISNMDFNGGLASGWTSEHDVEVHSDGGPVGASNSGTNVAELDAGSSGNPDAYYYSVDTSQGHDHQISLWVKQRDSYDGTDEIEVVWNGQVLQTIDPGTSWEEVTINLPDTDQASTQLAVREVAGQNNGVGPLLDQITISRFGADDSTDPAYDKVISSQEDTRIALDLSSSLSDSDGSETLSISLSGIPAGFALSDGTNSLTTDGNAVDASSWNLSNLTITPVANHDSDFTVTVTSTATEASNNDTATHTQTIRVDMQPVVDAAEFSGDDSATVTEDAAATLTASGSLSVTDADGSASFVAETVNGTYGSLTINTDGNWSYSADNTQNSIQSLDDGEQLTDAMVISSNDGTTHTIEITIQGTNDAPSLGAVQTISSNEDTSFTLSEAQLLNEVSATDVDGETLSVSNVSIDSSSISVMDNGDGTWTFTPDANWSGSGQIALDVSDGTATVSGQINVTISPDADAPVITPSGAQLITSMDFENDDIASGWTSENTPEINQASVYGVTDASGGNGYIMDLDDNEGASANTIDALRYTLDTSSGFDHELTFKARTRPDSLGTDDMEVVWNGEVIQTISPASDWDTVTIRLPAISASSGVLELRELSANSENDDHGILLDDVSIQRLTTISATEDTAFEFDLSAALVDNDGSETLSLSLTGIPSDYTLTDGSNTVVSSGSGIDISSWNLSNLSLTPASNANANFTMTLSATATENSGGDSSTTTHAIQVEIEAVNDSASISGDNTGAVVEDTAATLSASGSLTVSDVDTGEASFTAETINGSYGSLVIDANGDWTYSADNSQSAIQSLGDSQTLNLEGDWNSTARINSDLVTSDDFTVSLWVKPDTVDGSYHGFFGSQPSDPNDRSPSLWVAPDGDLHWSSVDVNGGSYSGLTDSLFTQGEWAHITWVKDGNEYRFYKDGNLVHTDSAPDNVKLSGYTELGRVDNTLDGQLDDLQTYSRALTPSEIADTMNGETQPDLLSHYDFAGSNLTEALTDKSGNQATGTSNGSLEDSDLITGRADTLTDTITVQSQDGTTHNITITLSGDNDAPVAATSNSVNLALNEDASLVITEAQLLARVSDVDDSHLSLSNVTLTSGQATLVDNNDGTWTLTPDADWSGNGTISFNISDGHSVSTIQTGFDVASINDAPILANSVSDQSVNEDSSFNFTVPENTFSHADGDTLTFTATQADDSAIPDWISFDPSTRTFSGTPDNDDVATLNLKVTATDEDGETVDASFSLVVNNVNDAPSPVFAQDNGLVSIEAEHFSSQVNRSGNAWSVKSDSFASGGEYVDTADNGLGFDQDYTGQSSELTYDIQFDSAGTYYVWVRGNETDGNGDSIHIGLNGEAVESGSRIDFDSTSMEWANDRMNGAGRITIEVTEPGTHQLNLWMREDGTGVDKIVISDDVNYVPSGSGPAESDYVGLSDQTVAEESAFSYTVDANAFNDLDGDNLAFSATLSNGDPLPAWMSFDAGTRTFSGTPDDPDVGTVQVRITASDASLSSSADVNINVSAVNDAPIAPVPEVDQFAFTWGGSSMNGKTADSYTLPDDYNLGDTFWVHKNDDIFRKAVEVQISDNGDGTVNIKAVSSAYTTQSNWNSLTTEQQANFFESGSGTTQTVSTSNSSPGYGISDVSINGGPTVSGFLDTSTGKNLDPFSSVENSSNGTIVGSVTATDVEGDNLTFSLSNDAGGRFAIDSSTGQVTVADGSLLDYETASTHSITVQVSDGELTSEQTYTVQLSDTNDAPELVGSIDDQTVAEESPFSYTLPINAFSDDEGDALTYSASLASGDPLPAWLSFNAGTRTFSGTPDDPDVGNISVKITVSDGSDSTDVFWSVSVTAVNDGPDLVSDTNTDEASIEGTAITSSASVLANDSDVENDPLTVTDVNGTTVSGSTTIEGDYGDLTISGDGNWTYTPASVDLSSGLVAHWSFDETSGTTVSDGTSGTSTDGVLKEGAAFVSGGLNGNAVQFDGASALVDITDSSELNTYSGNKTERTIDFSFKIDSDNDLSGRQVLYEEGGGSKGYNIYIDDGTLYVGAWANENGWDNGTYLTTDISSISSSDWQQVSLVLDSDNNSLKAYFNGEEFGSGHAEAMGHHGDEASFGSVSLHYNESSGETLRGATRFHDGSVDIPENHFGFDGLIDEARIYDRALNHQEVKALGYEFETSTLQDTFTYTVSDGTDTATSTLTIDVNRVPEALSGTLSATEDGGAIAGQLSAIDRDAGESLTFAVETQPSEGSVTVNADGSYSFNPGADFQDLAQGATRDVTFDYRVTDAQGDSSTNTVTITVTGTNDTANITSVETYTEDFNDFSAGDLNGQNGWVTEKSSSVDLSLADIGEDGSQALSFNQVSASAAGSLLNSVPDLSNASIFAFEADIAKNWWGTDFSIGGDNNNDGKIGKNDNEQAISIKPADHNDTLTLKLADGSTQTVAFSPSDGNGWTRFRIEVDLEANSGSGAITVKYKDLSAGETEWTTVSGLSGIDAQLNPAASDHTNPDNWNGIYINGDGQGVRVDNLMLEAKGDTTNAALTEDSGVDGSGNLVKSGLLIVNDTDTGEGNFTAETITGSYGSLTIDASGNWTYTASNSQNAIQSLDDGENVTDTLTVQTADGTTHDISVVISGMNDGPSVANVDLGSSNEDTDLVITEAQLLANSSDIDGDSLSITALTLDNGSHGSLTDNGNGTWTFSPADNFNGSDISFSFTVSDGTVTSSATATVDVTAVNDAPELSGSPLISGIDAAYSFSDSTDTSGNGNDLTLSGSATLGTGHNGGQAFEMDGTAGHADIAGLQTGGAMTLSTWVKYDSLSQSWSRIVDFGNGSANNNIILAHDGPTDTIAFEIYDGVGSPADGVLKISNFFTEGEWVHVTATVDDTGAMRIYKNGELAGENLNGAVPPELVRTNNYIGKSNWDGDGSLDGSIDDLAVFNSALNADQIKAVYEADSVENLVSDAFHVVENSANSTVLGSVAATDIDTASNELTYSLSNDAGGRFTINSTTGEITVADSGQLDHESNATHTITVQVSDGELSSTRDYTVYVTDINEAPTAADNTLSTNEDTGYTLTLADLGYSDQEGAEMTQIQVSTLPTEGALKLNGAAVTADQIISKADIDAGNLVFEPDSNEAGDDYASVGFKVHDGNSYSGEHNLTFNVAAVTDGATLNDIGTQVLNSTFDGNNADGWQRTNPSNIGSSLVQNNELYNW
ncbi:tandem-95 repeat protein, partial [Endozoicomonas arenosclerae]|uniref:tandem-95 repeat protein n=1 Tax=Endozoicomonas arenosclerae TaxID=1633495 RepID=UPI000AA96130